MENVDNTFCRFCAESKASNKLLNLHEDDKICDEVLLKLAFVNALYVNVNSELLPKTVCFVCYDSLNKAYEFLLGVKRAQDVLNSHFSPNSQYRRRSEEHESGCLDAYTSNDICESPDSDIDIKLEFPNKLYQLEVKVETKEEILDTNLLQNLPNDNELVDYPDSINDIIHAAIGNTPSLTLYAKDLSETSKRTIKTWNDYPWVCGFCNIEFMNVEMLRSHSKVVHGQCSAFLCIDCKTIKNNNFASFLKHVSKHRKSLRQYCHYCNEKVTADLQRDHIKTHILIPKVPCPLCGEIFNNEETLQCHLKEYNSPKRKRRPRRKPGTPITIEELTCPLCKKVYKNLNSLRDHMKLHTVDRKRNYTCDRCGKMFYNKGTLTSHIMSHDKIRPHVCRICNKSFLFPNMLRRHVEMHSGVKPFSCEQCGRCFRLQYQLNAHKIVHTDSMPYICQYCNKAFRFKQILKNHERQHTGAKPYSCKVCGMEFTNWSNFNKHMKRRHNMDTSKKKITPEGVFPINPETGQIIQLTDVPGTEEWKNRIMIPAKRGKKKIKHESDVN